MKTRTLLATSALVAAAVWLIFTWPLALHFGEGIPSGARNVEKHHLRSMIPGDHLQQLYYFHLAARTFAGRVPPFEDPWQFNAGTPEPFWLYHYYLPFSTVYAALEPLTGRAAARNLTGLLALWLGYLFTWLLVRRFVRREPFALYAALLGVIMPFRWHAALGGSPMEFALPWIPLFLLGLDIAVRNARPTGGLLAGIAVIFARCADAHAFLYMVLLAPWWCLASFSIRPGPLSQRLRSLPAVTFALLPAIAAVAAAGLYSLAVARKISLLAHHAGSRSYREIALYSPRPIGLFAWRSLRGLSNQIYLGFLVPAIICAGALRLHRRTRERLAPDVSARHDLTLLLIFALAVTAVVALALGPRGPFHGRIFSTARHFLPGLKLIRQPGKVFCLTPFFLAPALAIALAALIPPLPPFPPRPLRSSLLALLVAAVLLEYRCQVSPTICLLDSRQDAYAAVAAEARATGSRPHALAIPLWPGDSAWSSLYQYYSSLYDIRMVNGYCPIITRHYYRDVFLRFVSANSGVLPPPLLDDLLRRGVTAVILHENAFPEKVSPFAVSYTLDSLLHNPRLRLLHHAGPVWAFTILPRPSTTTTSTTTPCPLICPSRRWEAEKGHLHASPAILAPGNPSSPAAFVRLDQPSQSVTLRSTWSPPAPDLRWLIRARGRGSLLADTLQPTSLLARTEISLDSAAWQWYPAPCNISDFSRIALRLGARGRIDLDCVLLAAGDWNGLAMQPGKEIFIPAACLFHAGETRPTDRAVLLRPRRDPAAITLYGPKLPLAPGTYTLRLLFDTPASRGTVLGRFNVRRFDSDETGWTTVIAGRPAVSSYTHKTNLPFFIVFVYNRGAPMTLRGLSIQPRPPSS